MNKTLYFLSLSALFVSLTYADEIQYEDIIPMISGTATNSIYTFNFDNDKLQVTQYHADNSPALTLAYLTAQLIPSVTLTIEGNAYFKIILHEVTIESLKTMGYVELKYYSLEGREMMSKRVVDELILRFTSIEWIYDLSENNAPSVHKGWNYQTHSELLFDPQTAVQHYQILKR